MPPTAFGLADATGGQWRDTVACTRLYRTGRLAELAGFPAADIGEYLADESVTIWLDLLAPDHDDLAALGEEFGLHPMAVESALRHSQRPKLARYRGHLFLTAYAARLDAGTGELVTSEIAAFISSAHGDVLGISLDKPEPTSV